MNASERRILDTMQIAQVRAAGDATYEVCTTARADYFEDTRELAVSLDSFVRRFEMRGKDQILRPPWLPKSETVRAHVEMDEAPAAAKEIFSNWGAKVRGAVPAPEEWENQPAWLNRGQKVKTVSGRRAAKP